MKVVVLLECNDGELRQVVIPPRNLELLQQCLYHDMGKIRVLDKIINGVEIK